MFFNKIIIFVLIAAAVGDQVSIDDAETKVLRQIFHQVTQDGEYICKPGDNFQPLPALQTTFSIKHPALFKVTFQSSVSVSNGGNVFFSNYGQ